MENFTVVSEQYYMHIDPAVTVHATTRFPVADGVHQPNGEVDMPVVWTKKWGKGKVYYCSLGHVAEIVRMPEVINLMRRSEERTSELQSCSLHYAVPILFLSSIICI